MGGQSRGIQGLSNHGEDIQDGTNLRAKSHPPVFLGRSGSGPPDFNRLVPDTKLEWKSPMWETADFAFRVSFAGLFKVKREGSVKVEVSPNQVKATLANKLSDHVKLKLAFLKLDEKFFSDLGSAFQTASPAKFVAAFAKRVELALDWKLQGDSGLGVEGGAEIDWTPVFIRLYWEHTLRQDRPFGKIMESSFQGRVSVHAGFSKAGWAKIFLRFQLSAIEAILKGTPEIALRYSLFGSVLTLLLQAFTAYVIANARERGRITAAAAWYARVYGARVFGQPPPEIRLVNQSEDVQEFIFRAAKTGQSDARSDALELIKSAFGANASEMPEDQLFKLYRAYLINKYGPGESTAQWQLEQDLRKKIRDRFGE